MEGRHDTADGSLPLDLELFVSEEQFTVISDQKLLDMHEALPVNLPCSGSRQEL